MSKKDQSEFYKKMLKDREIDLKKLEVEEKEDNIGLKGMVKDDSEYEIHEKTSIDKSIEYKEI